MFGARSNWQKENWTIVHLPSGLTFKYNPSLTLLACKRSIEQYKKVRLQNGGNSACVENEVMSLITEAENILWREALALNP